MKKKHFKLFEKKEIGFNGNDGLDICYILKDQNIILIRRGYTAHIGCDVSHGAGTIICIYMLLKRSKKQLENIVKIHSDRNGYFAFIKIFCFSINIRSLLELLFRRSYQDEDI